MSAIETYESALAQYKHEYTKFVAVRQNYRRRLVGDSEFLAAKSELAKFERVLDAAEAVVKSQA